MSSMKVHTLFSYRLVEDEFALKESAAVIIDVLRASTTICTALHNGAREVVPVSSLGDAAIMASNLSKDVTILGGERQAQKPDGFDCGNSPFEYSEEIVKGKSVVFTTTNGTQALTKTKYAPLQFIGGFANLNVLIDLLGNVDLSVIAEKNVTDITLICAADSTGFAFEDAICAGAIAMKLQTNFPEFEFTDATRAAVSLYKTNRRSLKKFITTTAHARKLLDLGFEDDIDFCLKKNTSTIVPLLDGKSFKPFTNVAHS